MKRLEVYIDYKSPYAFVAMAPTLQLEFQFDVEIDWFPLTLNLGSYLGTARTNNSGQVIENNRSPRQWMAVRYAYYDTRRYARQLGLTLRGTQKIWDSSIAAIGLLWCKATSKPEVVRDYHRIVFHPFWRRELDIEDLSSVEGCLERAGAPKSGFADYLNGEGRSNHDQLQDDILDRGYFGVPTFVIDDEIYFGREHLPLIRWHLAGQKGACPDIAYDTVMPQQGFGREFLAGAETVS